MRLNNHRKDLWKPDAILASRHFSGKYHNFNTHAIFILTEKKHHIGIDKDKNKERLKQRENFWILTLETSKGLKALIKNLINIFASIILLTYFHLSYVC